MKDEYDFARAERGRFFRQGAVLLPPVHLDTDVLAALTTQARERGVSLTDLVNALLRREIDANRGTTPS